MKGSEWRIRRFGFREGTDEDLRALHSIEVPVEAERGSHRMPQPIESYIGFVRHLPSQLDGHTWLVESSGGSPVACGHCWSLSSGDPRVMECDILVHGEHRRRGIGTRLLARICDHARNEGRSLLVWETFEAVPAGEAFSRRLGARMARVSRTSELLMDKVDWAMIDSWRSAGKARYLGYSLQMVDGPYPDHLLADAVGFHQVMQSAPRDELEVADIRIDADFVTELDETLVGAGRERWAIFVRDRSGSCVGGTELTFDPGTADTAFQQGTGIDPAHRGLGLAKWAKATMLRRLHDERPAVVRVQTGNAYSNAPMVAVNQALGFEVTSSTTDWQAGVDDLARAAGAARIRRELSRPQLVTTRAVVGPIEMRDPEPPAKSLQVCPRTPYL